MLLEVDENANWILVKDNGDGTMTQQINAPEFNIHNQTVVMAVNFFELLNMGRDHPGASEIINKTTVIPNSPEEE